MGFLLVLAVCLLIGVVLFITLAASTTWLVLAIAGLFAVVSLILIISRWNDVWVDIGQSLLTGSIVAFALFLLQIQLDETRKEEAEEEQFRLSIGLTDQLRGLDPARSLEGMYLSGKTLDDAELRGEDLSETNLSKASLRGANLENAVLTDADLYGADLTEANLLGADLRRADLQFASLEGVAMDAPLDAKLKGATVNSRTCWPEDFLANLHQPDSALKDRLIRKDTAPTGRTLVPADSPHSWGRACVLDDTNIFDALGLYASDGAKGKRAKIIGADESRQTVNGIGTTFSRSPANILRRFSPGRDLSTFNGRPPSLESGVCAGSRGVTGRQGGVPLEKGFTLLIRQDPRQGPERSEVIRIPGDRPGERYVVRFDAPLQRDSSLILFAEKEPPGDPETLVKYRSKHRVVAC